jgi:hypothetical protein
VGPGRPGSGHGRAHASAVGARLGGHLARLDRAPAILFVSAFTDPDLPWDVLAKPFPPDALLGAVSRLLESQERSGSRLEWLRADAAPVVAGEASLVFCCVSSETILGFRFVYIGQGSGIRNFTILGEDYSPSA